MPAAVKDSISEGTVPEGTVPQSHFHMTTKAPWPSVYNNNTLKYPITAPPTSSPLPMSPESLPPYLPHLQDSALPSQDLGTIPTSSWFGSTVPAHENNETGFTSYTYEPPYVTPHTSSVTFSPPMQLSKGTENPATIAQENRASNFSPVSDYSRFSDPGQSEAYTTVKHPTGVPAGLLTEPVHPERPRSSPSIFTPGQVSSAPLDPSWAMNNPLGISTSMQQPYCPGSSYPSPRRMYAPIAPHPLGPQSRSVPKRSRDDDECSDQIKRRKRSDSNTTATMELSDEDKLLIQLKDEESMPWKDIAARFQSDLGKTYQIPALQMRLKRLRERMRVWTETDVRALRLAHEYWVQSKFDIISQKMLEFGAAEKWTVRQCARKWAEIDPGPTPYSAYDHPSSFAPYTMSPVEATPSFMPYLHGP
ncbi:hypothetical protein BU24DRAFT_424952 [Aaosphaeria arxii CBS 175.79]|uniref:Myb-like domain-containing protein n=1 Tax=Aaosphaeria arxii CBS 175.79 TaxID=1450172 RepID=A0A6A5XLV0_9PLEO|nr:uncharacterized protein BU24DRAFT_424952 [Aaosphaeria arxii CBS 175.79]KAF2013933.1 hypothetical protein BU24DRAFT_424952 [Aaosphaeria arxii CBS 175.79]